MNNLVKSGLTLTEGGKATFIGFQLERAFTLAEFLITLAIIGVIAAMTLPVLMNSTNHAENVVALKKAYEVLNQAYYSISAENGNIQNALSGATTPDDFANVFISKLNVAKNCGTTNAKAIGCFTNATFKYLNGSDVGNFTTNSAFSTILTNDGISYSFRLESATCSNDISNPTETISSPLYKECGRISVDVNGPNKGPFVDGRDLFRFFLTKTGIYPQGAYPANPASAPDDDCSIYGGACTAKVLLEGAMNY